MWTKFIWNVLEVYKVKETTFMTRNGLYNGELVVNDFPKQSRIGLFNVIHEYVKMGAFELGWTTIKNELFKTCRILITEDSKKLLKQK